jgi:hypothetical protein
LHGQPFFCDEQKVSPGLLDAIVMIFHFRLADSRDGRAENEEEGDGKNMFCQSRDSAECGVGFQGSPNLFDVRTQSLRLSESNRVEIISFFEWA